MAFKLKRTLEPICRIPAKPYMGDTMSGVDVSDTVSEISDEMKGDDIINKQWVAVYISIVAVLLTIATTCG